MTNTHQECHNRESEHGLCHSTGINLATADKLQRYREEQGTGTGTETTTEVGTVTEVGIATRT